jgi:hypothetical protein
MYHLVKKLSDENIQNYNFAWPIPVAAQSKVSVCGCSLAGIVGSNPARGMHVYLL